MIHLKRFAIGFAIIVVAGAIGFAVGYVATLAYYGDLIPIAILLVFVSAYGIGSLWVEDK